MGAGTTFRDQLVKSMPGYSWTVHRHSKDAVRITATGTQSSGFNRLSTLQVDRREIGGVVSYTAKSAGYGLRAKWLHENTDSTLARALRGLQQHYERMQGLYWAHARAIAEGREVANISPTTSGDAKP
jgi:hypothetical protein